MPEAIATTKRKFYKALDALTSTTPVPPVTSTPSSSSSIKSSSSKRTSAAALAFDEARQRARKRLRQSTSTTSLNSEPVISLPPRSAPKNKDGSAKAPNYSPWSQDTFLARLKTFSSVSLWHPKPDPISEVVWAKRGWSCVDVNTVACKGGCERRVVVSMEVPKRVAVEDNNDDDDDDDETAAFEEALAERYRSEVVEGHTENCLWHKAGCKDDIYRLPVVRPSIWQPELSKRFRSSLSISPSVENVTTRSVVSTSAASTTLLQDLPREVIPIEDVNHPGFSKAFEIAMHGWRGSSESGNDLLNCDACFQRIGLWMYQPSYRRRPSPPDTSPHEDEEGQDNTALIDLVEMHRDHCPWRNPSTQHATGSLTGLNACQILQRVATTCARDHRRRSNGLQAAADAIGGEGEGGETDTAVLDSPPKLSREEIARQDKERESRLSKLKNLFNIKRRSTVKAPLTKSAS